MAQNWSETNFNLLKLHIGDKDYFVKDAEARAILDTYAVTDCAAKKSFTTTVTASSDALPTSDAVKTYVDNAVKAIHNFDIVVCEADATKIPKGATYKDGSTTIVGTMEASAETMYKIYMVKNTDIGTGAYAEYLTLRTGTESSYTYSWEMIGSTVVDLSDYVKKTTTIAGLALTTNIAKADLQSALSLKALAYKDNATGSIETIDSITMNELTSEGEATISYTTTAMTSSGTFTPSGSIVESTTGIAVASGVSSFTVSLTDSSATAEFSTTSYTPQGSTEVTYEKATGATLAEDSANGVQISGSVSAPEVTVTPATTEVKVIATEGSAYEISGGSAELSGGTTTTVVTEGVTATPSVISDRDYQITFAAASTTTVVNKEGSVTYTTPTLNGTWPTFATQSVATGIQTTTVSAPTFTGNKFKINLTTTATTQSFTLSGTTVTVINPTGDITYKKPTIETATITLASTKLGFTGTEGSVSVSGNYEKANSSVDISVSGTPTTKSFTKTAKTVTVS